MALVIFIDGMRDGIGEGRKNNQYGNIMYCVKSLCIRHREMIIKRQNKYPYIGNQNFSP